MSRAKILFITPQPFFLERGSPYRVRAEVQAIVAQGVEVDLLSYPFGRDTELEGVQQFRCAGVWGVKDVPIGWSGRKLLLDVSLFWKAFQLMLGNRYAAVHGVEDAGIMAAFLTLVFRVPYIFDMHSHMTEQLSQCVLSSGSPMHRFLCRVEQWCMRRASGIITVSDTITARARSIAPAVPAMTLEDLALGGVLPPDEALVTRLKAEFDIDAHDILLYTGNFEPYQGIDLLLESFAKLIANAVPGKKPRLVLVGGGNPSDARFQFYRSKVEELGITREVIFAGQRSESEMEAYMAVAQLLLSPRIAGAHTPLKIYTYMAANKPIVATRIAAHVNVLNGDNSFLAEPDADSFARMMLSALASDENSANERAAKVARASQLLQKRFSRTEFNRRMAVLYRAARGEYLSDEVLLSPEKLELRQQQQSWS